MRGTPAVLNGELTRPLRTEAEARADRAERLTLEQQAERDTKAAIENFAPMKKLIDDMFGGFK